MKNCGYWAKTFPWDHPIARKLDHEVHRRRMAGEFHSFFIFSGVGPFSLYLFFFDFSQRYSRGSIFYDPCCGLSTYVFALDVPDSIGPRDSGFQPVRVDFHFFVRFLGTCGKPTRLPYIPVGRPSHPKRSL